MLVCMFQARQPYITHPHSLGSSQLPLKPALKLPRRRWLVWIVQHHNTAQCKNRGHETPNLEDRRAGFGVGVFLWREHSQNVVVLVNRLAVIPTLLLIPPVAIRIAELAFDSRGVDVSSVLSWGLATDSVSRECTDHPWVFSLGLCPSRQLDYSTTGHKRHH